MENKLECVFKLIDDANRLDPNREPDTNGINVAKELLYSQRMSQSLDSFCPHASDLLKIAARAQHIERWTSPRSDFPAGRTGYKKWRSMLYLYHANRAAELANEAGYSEDETQRIKYLVQKRGLKKDEESQTLEDVVCLVFLEHYLEDFIAKHDDVKLIDIIQKTWSKMSEKAHQFALQMQYSDKASALIHRALAD